MADTRVAVLFFDSPSIALLQRGVRDGWLPTIRSLLDGGRASLLGGHQEILTTSSWPTLLRGCDVDEHELFCDRMLQPGSYRVAPAGAELARRPPFWWYAHQQGLRTTVASVYSAPLVPGLSGNQLIGWGTHDPFTTKDSPPRSEPPGLLERVERVTGRSRMGFGLDIPRTESDFRSYREQLLRLVEQQTSALLYLAEATEWDLFVSSYAHPHESGHFLLHQVDPSHPLHDPETPDDIRSALPDVYRAVDDGIGRVIERLGDDVTVFVGSPYSLGADNHLNLSVDAVLRRSGLLSSRAAGDEDLTVRLRSAARAVLRKVLPLSARRRLGGLVPRERWVDALTYADVDWAGTTVFPLPTDGSSSLRVNLRGREPAGTVDPGGPYDDLFTTVSELFHGLRDGATGEPVTRRVERFDQLTGSPVTAANPDFVVEWADSYRVRSVESPEVGTIELPLEQDPRTALHGQPGFLLGRGPAIDPSGRPELGAYDGTLVDVGATVLSHLGVEVPPPGTPIEGLRG